MDGQIDTIEDEALARMAKEGDREAFNVLCDRYVGVVYNRLRALLPVQAVDDVTQEVFLAATRGIRRYRAQSSFRTWISAIVRHKVADYYRTAGRQPESSSLDGDGDPEPVVRDRWEERAIVRLALRRLPVHYQEILLLRFAEGLPFTHVAAALGISLEATKSRYRRAIAAIAKEMEVG
ncbi:MAG: RNA polymerase sigma factor [Anaerolineae bacterium]|nr:RNA polymerase sigma factor [Anaerolineae bacterium]